MFAQTVVSVLLSRLSILPLTTAVVHRVRRYEARYLRALTGWQRTCASAAQFAEFTRKARKIAFANGHSDLASALFTRVYETAGRWARIPRDTTDLALRDFSHAWDSSLCATWEFQKGHGAIRARLGRPTAG